MTRPRKQPQRVWCPGTRGNDCDCHPAPGNDCIQKHMGRMTSLQRRNVIPVFSSFREKNLLSAEAHRGNSRCTTSRELAACCLRTALLGCIKQQKTCSGRSWPPLQRRHTNIRNEEASSRIALTDTRRTLFSDCSDRAEQLNHSAPKRKAECALLPLLYPCCEAEHAMQISHANVHWLV